MKSPWLSGKQIGLGERLSMGSLSTRGIQIRAIFSLFYGVMLWVVYGMFKIYVETFGHQHTMGQLRDETSAYLYARYIAMVDNVFWTCTVAFIIGMGFVWIPVIIKRFGKGE